MAIGETVNPKSQRQKNNQKVSESQNKSICPDPTLFGRFIDFVFALFRLFVDCWFFFDVLCVFRVVDFLIVFFTVSS